jgi:hypothetical protein
MKITKGEYCQFNLKSREELLGEFGKLEFERTFCHVVIRIFSIYDFYVEVVYNLQKGEIEKIEPVNSFSLLHTYEHKGPSQS